jgi:hypothetical protein
MLSRRVPAADAEQLAQAHQRQHLAAQIGVVLSRLGGVLDALLDHVERDHEHRGPPAPGSRR